MAGSTDSLLIRIPPEKKRIWKAFAANDGRTLTDLIIVAVDGVISGRPYFRQEELDELHQLREQLRRAGINLNLLVRELTRFNGGGLKYPPEPRDFDFTRQQLAEALDQVLTFLRIERPK
jgi:hypothetical protein